jgi:acetyltransferase-like isoleucine patch superfamily enzyme
VHLHAEPGARISIGNGTYLNRNTMVWAAEEVLIGAGAMISWDVIISDSEGFGDCSGIGRVEPVSIGDHAWIGAKAVILAGARIGDGAVIGAVIGAGAVVTGVVNPGQIVVAQAARPLLDLRSRS